MNNSLTRSFTLACSLGLLIAGFGAESTLAGQLNKWVDKDGIVHYGDAVPVEQADYAREVLSNEGVVTMSVDRAKTKEELAEARRKEELRKQAEKIRRAQAAKDHVLLATFSSVDDMIMTRDGKIAAIDTFVRLAEDRITRVTQQLQEQAHQAAEIERSGRPVPTNLHKQIASSKAEILHHGNYIKSQRAEQESIRERFARDIDRFRHLQKRVAGMAAEIQ